VTDRLLHPKSVLFVCNRNAVRSPMAEALARRHCRGRIFIASAGLEAGELDPFAIAAMAEDGIDISRHRPLLLGEVDTALFDLAIALTEAARDAAMARFAGPRQRLELWPMPDPAEATGSRDVRLDAYRGVRAALRRRIEDRFVFEKPAAGPI